ncbi:hypothetical protein CY35_03G117600 [Sphagnum magellanicum]|nr:hypothetical protein CY35_03G117600 [Sphagnum magellanicum]KAH9569165.1 hypothetical protein CY35_03G117600 [Sphagnum magellanicum]
MELFCALRGFCALPDGAMAMATLTARPSLGSAHHIQSLHGFPLTKNLASRSGKVAVFSGCRCRRHRALIRALAEGNRESSPPSVQAKEKSSVPETAPAADGTALNQLLGMKGAALETDKWKIQLQLMKPVTWAPLMWGVLCGAAASGNFHWTPEDVAKSLTCMFTSGPLLTGYTQTINDWYDREIDAINEPYRPIPSGAVSETEVIAQIWVLLLGGLAVAYGLDVWLKQSGWIGNYALGSSYISLPWWAGQSLFGTLSWDIVVLTLLYSTAGLGIAIVNDFKSIEGDRAMGLQSLPVAFGIDTAKWICVGSIDVTQLSVAAYLFATGKTYYALGLLALIVPQIILQFQYFLQDPLKYDVKYQASAQPFFVFGLLLTAFATNH